MALYVVMRSGLAVAGVVAPSATTAPADEPVLSHSCESLFWALNGRDLVVLGKRWHVEVFSVVELAGRRYMQLSVDGPTHNMLTLRLAPGTSDRRLIPAVLSWLRRPTAAGEVLDVT